MGNGPDPALAVALRGHRTRSPVALREPARDARQPRLPTSRLWNRRLWVTAVVSAEHPRDRAPRHRLLPPRAAADPSGRPRGAAAPLANARRQSLRPRPLHRVLAARAGLLHRTRSRPVPPALPLRDRRQRARLRALANALGRTALPPPPRPVRRRANRGRGPRPRAIQRAGVRHGSRTGSSQRSRPAPSTATSPRLSRPPPTARTAGGFATRHPAATSGAASMPI